MGIAIEHREELPGSSAAAWGILRDLPRWPEWAPSILELRPLDGAELVVGARFAIRQPRMPRLTWEVESVELGESFTWSARSPGLSTRASHQLEASGADRCRLVLRIEQRGLLASTVGRLSAARTRRYLALEARGLAGRLAGG